MDTHSITNINSIYPQYPVSHEHNVYYCMSTCRVIISLRMDVYTCTASWFSYMILCIKKLKDLIVHIIIIIATQPHSIPDRNLCMVTGVTIKEKSHCTGVYTDLLSKV